MNIHQTWSIYFDPTEAACVSVIIDFGHGIHCIMTKGFQIICVTMGIVGVQATVCFSSIPVLEEVVIQLSISRSVANSEPVISLVYK